MGKTIGLTGALEAYYAAHACREAPLLAELRAETAKLGSNAAMQIGPEQGAFMGLLVKLMGARRVIEFGTFTGYSSLAMALAGATRITCADVSKDFTDIARRYWAKAGVADRIDLRLDGGRAVIARCLAAGEAGTFDLAFIDADKSGYDAYYEGSIQLLRAGGLVLVDNTLWDGDVANPAKQDDDTRAIRALNDKLVKDPRVEICLVPICDGLTMARKL
ncbi:MAG: class I SAM-dependent methyltransferase [Aestuariivirga sp.]|uniref:class I SAM-dependent methyltransferase n=1 Tax=Aestuariivirga sp. TaxID=2650926 RepID=UPI00301ABD46